MCGWGHVEKAVGGLKVRAVGPFKEVGGRGG